MQARKQAWQGLPRMRLHLALGTAGAVTAQILRMRKLRLTGRWGLVKVTQAGSDRARIQTDTGH